MLKPGDKVPAFTLPVGYPDGRREDVAFTSLLGKGPIVLSFFPLAFTRVCTTQMCDMRDHAPDLDTVGAQVFGFSCDSKWTNAKFAAEQQLAHGIFSDANREIVDTLWETQRTAGVDRVPKRGWMVINASGIVVDAHITDIPGDPWVGTHTIRAALARC